MNQAGRSGDELRADVVWGVRGVVRLLPVILLVALLLLPARASFNGWTLDDFSNLWWALPGGVLGWIIIGAYVGLLRPLTARGNVGAAMIGASFYGILGLAMCIGMVVAGEPWSLAAWAFTLASSVGVGALFGVLARWAIT